MFPSLHVVYEERENKGKKIRCGKNDFPGIDSPMFGNEILATYSTLP
jgi:hypothetical protein